MKCKISGIRNEYNGIDVEINIYGKDGHIVDCVLYDIEEHGFEIVTNFKSARSNYLILKKIGG